jgi:hypothetical protein
LPRLATLAAIADTVLGKTGQNGAIDLQAGFIVSLYNTQPLLVAEESVKQSFFKIFLLSFNFL